MRCRELGPNLLQRFAMASDERDLRAMPCEFDGARAADSLGTAANHRLLAFQHSHVFSLEYEPVEQITSLRQIPQNPDLPRLSRATNLPQVKQAFMFHV